MPATAHASRTASAPPVGRLGDPVTPGSYMKGCRLRAGMSLDACAEKMSHQPAGRIRFMQDMRSLEADRAGDYAYLITQLNRHEPFAFDFGTFTRLAAQTCDASFDEWEER